MPVALMLRVVMMGVMAMRVTAMGVTAMVLLRFNDQCGGIGVIEGEKIPF